jgi:hypothetical protein
MSTLPTKTDEVRMVMERLNACISIGNNYRRRAASGPNGERKRAASVARDQAIEAVRACDDLRRAVEAWRDEDT